MYHLCLATPEKVILNGDVRSLIAPGAAGYLEILTNHAPIITSLIPGKLEVTDKAGKKLIWILSGGFLKVSHNQALLLADAVELPSEIDVNRAEVALKRAREALASSRPELNVARAKEAKRRAKNRLKVGQEGRLQ